MSRRAREWARLDEPPAPVRLPESARILAIKAAGIGDLLLAVPALRALRGAYPAARIDVLATPQAAALLDDSPLVDRVLTVDKAPFAGPRAALGTALSASWRLRAPIALWRELHAERYDAVLLLHHLTLPFGRVQYRLLLAATRPALRAGLENGHGGFLDVRVPDRGFGARHEAEYWLEVAAAVGASVPGRLFGPSLADLGWEDEYTPASTAPPPSPPLIALHAGSGMYSRARRWPLARFAELARALHREWDARVVLVAGPDEEDSQRAQWCRELLGAPEWVAIAAPSSLRETAALLARCTLFIGNDSLPMHLAAAAGAPVVGIFGPSNHRAWRPLPREPGGFATVVRRELACSPCFYTGHALGTPHGCPPRPCLTELEIGPVLAAARHALRQSQRGQWSGALSR